MYQIQSSQCKQMMDPNYTEAEDICIICRKIRNGSMAYSPREIFQLCDRYRSVAEKAAISESEEQLKILDAWCFLTNWLVEQGYRHNDK